MGICYSKKKKKKLRHHQNQPSSISDSRFSHSKSPPENSFLEETVKEVLSETPNTKPLDPTSPTSASAADDRHHHKKPSIFDDPSDASEICSQTETFSTATLTERKFDDPDDDDASMRPPRRPTSPAKPPGPPAARSSSSKRSDASPGRRPPPREGPVNRPWVPAGTNAARREIADYSSRRSRSPAKRSEPAAAASIGRCASARRTGMSPGRAPARSPGENWRRRAASPEKAGSATPPASESLENPLVSLECFIFL